MEKKIKSNNPMFCFYEFNVSMILCFYDSMIPCFLINKNKK